MVQHTDPSPLCAGAPDNRYESRVQLHRLGPSPAKRKVIFFSFLFVWTRHRQNFSPASTVRSENSDNNVDKTSLCSVEESERVIFWSYFLYREQCGFFFFFLNNHLREPVHYNTSKLFNKCAKEKTDTICDHTVWKSNLISTKNVTVLFKQRTNTNAERSDESSINAGCKKVPDLLNASEAFIRKKVKWRKGG